MTVYISMWPMNDVSCIVVSLLVFHVPCDVCNPFAKIYNILMHMIVSMRDGFMRCRMQGGWALWGGPATALISTRV